MKNVSRLYWKHKTCPIHHEYYLYNFHTKRLIFQRKKAPSQKSCNTARDGLDLANCCTGQNHEYATQQRTLHMHRHSLGPSSTKTVISTQHPHHHILSHHTPVLSTRVLTGVSGTWPSVTSRLSKTRPQVRKRRPQVRPSKASLECYAVEVSLRIFLDDGAVPIIQRRGCCGCVLVTKSARDCCRSSVRWWVIGKIDGWSSAFGLSWMSCRNSELLCGEISVFPYPCWEIASRRFLHGNFRRIDSSIVVNVFAQIYELDSHAVIHFDAKWLF